MTDLKRNNLILIGIVLVMIAAHLLIYRASEPFYYNDETRHVMTGVFFRDFIHDMPIRNLKGYTVGYFLQYPALGLLVWPPLFYFIEGAAMTLFGTSILVSKTLIVLFAAMACAYLFHFARRLFDPATAVVATLLFAFAPTVFEFSHYVMLEVPALAFGLAATYHFVRYLEDERKRDIFLAALFSAFCALTRFDAVYLLPLFVILIVARKRWNILLRREVIASAIVALVIVAPFYAVTAQGVGWFHFKQATETLQPNYPHYLSVRRYLFYPESLPSQVGWIALVLALVGLGVSLRKENRAAAWPFIAMFAVTYLTFTMIGEMESRHTIYWIPAIAVLAAIGVREVGRALKSPAAVALLAVFVVLVTGWVTIAQPRPSLTGYADVARYVVANSKTSPFCLFIGKLNGDFVYQMRRSDSGRRMWVMRADKMLYSMLTNSQVDYKKYAASDQDVLDTIFKYDPEFIVVENPLSADQLLVDDPVRTAAENDLRRLLAAHSDRFQLEKTFPLNFSQPGFGGMEIKVFRNLLRNEHPVRKLEMELLMLRKNVQTDVR